MKQDSLFREDGTPNFIQIKVKICPTCKIEKSFKEFYRKKSTLDGLGSQCKACRRLYSLKGYNPVTVANQSKRKTIVGQKYGRLLVLCFEKTIKKVEVGKHTKYKIYWKCKCDCGVECIKESYQLRTGSVKQCRECTKKDLKTRLTTDSVKQKQQESFKRRFSNGESCINKIFGRYKGNSKQKNRNFELTKEEFKSLIFQNCFYCDRPPSQKEKSTFKTLNYNGIDRVDNNRGYELDNVVTCCGLCNKMKLNFTQEDFFQTIKRIFKKHIKE